MRSLYRTAIRAYSYTVTATELHRLRSRLGLTQAQLADVVGVTPNTIARWERGEMRMQPAMDRLVRLSVAQAEAGRERAAKKR